MQLRACDTLRNLAINVDNQITLMTNGAIGLILAAMHAHPNKEKVQESVCYVLRSLASTYEANRRTLTTNGALELILVARRVHPTLIIVQDVYSLLIIV